VPGTFIRNIGTLVLGPIGEEPIRETSLLIEDGRVAAIGVDAAEAARVLDIGGLDVIPGLIDGHVHPAFGEWTPAQDSIGWMSNYVHGGTTSFVSAGELHLPGLPLDAMSPRTAMSVALASRDATARLRPLGARVFAGTILLVQGMTEADFDVLADAGVKLAKFIFYDWASAPAGEAQAYVEWAHQRGMRVKMHSGGVSRSGSSKVAGYELVKGVAPDIVAHISGGPIPMPDPEIEAVIADLSDTFIEVCSSMNYRATQVAVAALEARDDLDRLTLGTDTPGGTGVIPRGMLRNICFLAAVCGVDPVRAIAAATDNVGRAHGLDIGRLTVGAAADLVILGPIQGSRAASVLDCFRIGDLPGIAQVLIGGEPAFEGRSRQTPPPIGSVAYEVGR